MNNASDVKLKHKADRSQHSQYWWCLFGVLAIASAIFFTNLGVAQLWDRDEPRNAGCAAEMLKRNDWVVPIFNGELRYQKPVLLYWLTMGAYKLFGVNEFAARFCSALLAVGTVAITYSIALRLFGLWIAIFSGIILSSNLMFTVAARAATPDSVLIFFSTLAIGCFVWGSEKPPHQGLSRSFGELDLRWLLLMGISMGLAMLAKGPIGFLMPMAIMGMLLLITRRDKQKRSGILATISPLHFLKTTIAMRPLILLAIALAVALPWYVWVGIRTEGDFLHIFFVSEHLGRSTTAFENHSGGLWFYPVAILVGFFPWSLFWLPVAIISYRFLKNSTAPADGVILAICWIAVQVGIFSLAQTKLPSYVTPCYPGLSILFAASLHFWLHRHVAIDDRWMLAAVIIGIIVGVAITIGLGIAVYHFLPGQYWMPGIGAVLILFSSIALVNLKDQKRQKLLISFSIGAVSFCVLLFGFGTVSLSTAQNNRLILNRIAAMEPEVAVASFECLESSWSFYSGRTIHETSRYADPVSTNRVKFWKPKPVTTPESFAAEHEDCVFITADEYADALINRLPEGFKVVETADYFLKNKQLVLISRD